MAEVFKNNQQMSVGVISDTHGLLRNGIIDIFKYVNLIIHAGDIGNPEILEQLNTIAPVIAVRGNMDSGTWTKHLPKEKKILVGDATLFMLHSLYGVDIEAIAPDADVVVSGHTHQPEIREKNGVLFVNPGSAGPRRYDYPVSVAILDINRKNVSAKIINIE